MANRTYSRVQALNHTVKLIPGSFSVDATANTCTKMQGKGFSVEHLDEGVYAIDLEDKYPHMLAALVQTKKSSAGDLNAQIKSYNVSSASAASLELQDITYSSVAEDRSGNDLSVTYEAAAASVGVLNLTADITLTKVAVGSANNTKTFTLQVLAAAPNPTDTVLVSFTGTQAAIVCTVTPNDGTNNTATPVDLTTAELRELITSGAVVGKTITLTDASSLRALQTATGGGATALADGGEGDGVVATFASGTGVAAGAVVSFASGALNVIIEDGVTDADTIYAALIASNDFNINFTAEITGSGSDAQDAASETSLSGGASAGLIVQNLAGATPTDADCEIHFQLYLLNTSAN